jgi:alpha-glucosidase
MQTGPAPETLWWKTGVMYHCYVRSFMDGDGDGVGDLPGLISRLDTLGGLPGSLGINGLWLSPIYPSPGYDFGYDISDYRAVDPVYGTLDDFRRLVGEAKRRDIHVIMDLVVNHSSTEHTWFRQARTSRDNPFHDYYIWHEGKAGRPPSNWGSTFGGSAWEWNEATQEFYLHSFLKQQADLNWRNPALRREVHDIMRFWMDLGVDGFRLDVANYYVKDQELRDNPHEFIWCQPMPGNTSRTLPVPMRREVCAYTVDRPETHEALKGMRCVIDEQSGRMMVGEITPHSLDQVLSYYGNGNDELNLVFNFFFFVRRFCAADFRDIITRTCERMPHGAWPAWVLSNHDVVRAASRYHLTREMTRAMTGLLLTIQGTPFLYYGDELGLENAALPRRLLQDPVGRKYWPLPVGRDGERTPFPWDGTPNAGFTAGIPWLPVTGAVHNRAAQSADPGSVLNFTSRLIRFRSQHPALYAGEMTFTGEPSGDCLTFTAPDERMKVMINLSQKTVPFPADEMSRDAVAVFDSEDLPAAGMLCPWEVRITRPV